MRKEKRLSPNVLDRFQEYENLRSKSKIVKTINRIKEVTPQKLITAQLLSTIATPK